MMKEDLIPARARLLKELDYINSEIDKHGLGRVEEPETTTVSTIVEETKLEPIEEPTKVVEVKEETKEVVKRKRGRQPGYKPKKK